LSRNPIKNGMPKPTKACSAREEEEEAEFTVSLFLSIKWKGMGIIL
jgi:hypothetical protein